MNISNITNTHDDYNNTSDADDNNGNIEMVIQLVTIIPCGLSLILLIVFMTYTLVKPLIHKK